MVTQEIRREIRSRLEAAFQGRLHDVVLFGSHARNELQEDSDLDLLVLLERPIRLGKDLETIVWALYPVQLELEIPIHAIPVARDSYEAGGYGPYALT